MPPYCSALEEMSKKHYLERCWFVQKHAKLDLKDMFHNHKFVEKNFYEIYEVAVDPYEILGSTYVTLV